MIKIEKPQLVARDVFATCISKVANANLKQRLIDVTDDVQAASDALDVAVAANTTHQIQTHEMVGLVTRKEMEAVYTNRMAKLKSPGRAVYDALMASAPRGKCPLCAHRNVSTLDHYLPKAEYPSLVVAPLNLVPACSDCNKTKLATRPQSAEDEPLHPYFDHIDNHRWLYAEVIETNPAAFRFFVNGPVDLSQILQARVSAHFTSLKLALLYSAAAADEVLNISHQMEELHAAGGAVTVRLELQSRANSSRAARLNGWRTATFEAMVSSDWFCDGGFRV
jgi:hypothetical protein